MKRQNARRSIGLRAGLAAAAVLVAAPLVSRAADRPKSLDEQLELQPAPATQPSPARVDPVPPPPGGPGRPGDTAKPVGPELNPELKRRLTGQEAADAFHQAIAEMGDASERLGKRLDPGADTQRLQASILAKLDQVIEAAEQQQQQQPSSSGQPQQGDPSQQKQDQGSEQNQPGQQQPGQGQQQGVGQQQNKKGDNRGEVNPQGGTRGMDPGDLTQVGKESWGNLPPRLRDELLQGVQEAFSPVYRDMTEMYYRRLAEEKK